MLTCSCCGSGVTCDDNVVKDQVPYPFDEGYGLCIECGGDDKADTSTLDGFKRALGWQKCMFYEARFSVVRDALNEQNKQKWDKLSYAKKCHIVHDFVEKGWIKW